MQIKVRKTSTILKVAIILLVLVSQFGWAGGSAASVYTSISGTIYGPDGNPLTGVSVLVQAIRKADGTGAASTYSNLGDGRYLISGLALDEAVAIVASNDDPDVDGYTARYYNNAIDLDWAASLTLTTEAPSITGVDITLDDRLAPDEQLTFNVRSGRILEDLNLRKAIAYATDRQAIFDGAFVPEGYYGGIINSLTYPEAWYKANDSDPLLTVYSYSTSTAETLLAASGWLDSDGNGYIDKGGQELSLDFITTDSSTRVAAADIFRLQMQFVGIRVNVYTYPTSTFFSDDPAVSRLAAGDFDIAEFAWIMSTHDYLSELYNTGDEQNFGGYANASLDGYWEAARAAKEANDSTTFYSNALNWQYEFSDDLPAFPLFARGLPSIYGMVNGADGNPLTGVSIQVDVHLKSDDSIIATGSTNSADGTYYVSGLPMDEELYVCASNEDPDVDGYIGECFNNASAGEWAVSIVLTMYYPERGGVDFTLNDHSSPYPIEQFTFNTQSGRILEDVSLRQAIAYGTDRQAILETIWEPAGTTGEILNVMLYPEEWFAIPADDPYLTVYDYLPDVAVTKLEESGWFDTDADGFREKGGQVLELEFYTTTSATRVATADLFKTQMELIGIKINVTTFSNFSFLDAGEFDIAEFAWSWNFGYDGLVSMYLTGDSQNYGGYSNANLDDYYLVAQSRKVSDDTVGFQLNAQNWQYEFSAQLPVLPLFSRISVPLPVISGYVLDSVWGAGLEVIVRALDGSGTEVASTFSNPSDGSYSLPVPYGFIGSVVPEHSDYQFDPVSRLYTYLTIDIADQDYTGTLSYLLTVSKAGTGSGMITSNPAGISCGTDCTESFASGTVVKLTATASAGSAFTGWSGACGGVSTTCYVTMSKAKSATATFTTNPVGKYYLSTVKVGSGTIVSTPAGISCPTDCSEFFNSGTSVKLVATASAGYVFTGWSGACGGTTNPCTIPMTKNKTVTATFLAVPAGTYYLGVQKVGPGSVASISPAGGISCGTDCSEFYTAATVVRLKATPDAGYKVTWSGACGGTSLNCYVTMGNHKYVKATFTVDPASRGDRDSDTDSFLPGLLDLIAWDPLEIWRLAD